MSETVSLRSRIPTSVPGFIREDHPIFVKFVEAYFEYLERQNGPVSFIRDALKNISPSESLDEFVKYFFEEVKNIPPSALADRRLLAEHIYELYQAKGTVKSFELFFRLMYNENIQIYFPKDDILKTSDGKWDRSIAIRAIPISGNIFDCVGNRISQVDYIGNVYASANVENVIGRDNGQYDVYLSPNSVVGTIQKGLNFKFDESIFSAVDVPNFSIKIRGSGYSNGDRVVSYEGEHLDVKVRTILAGSITNVFILDGGVGHSVGDKFIVESDQGSGADIRVSNIDESGAVTGIKIISGGQGFVSYPRIKSSNDTGVFIAIGDKIGAIGDLRILDPGQNHLTPPIVNVDTTVVLTDPLIGFTPNEPIEVLPERLCTENYYTFLTEDGDSFLNENTVDYVVDARIYDFNQDTNLAKVSGIVSQIKFLDETLGTGFLTESGEQITLEQSSGDINRRTIRGVYSSATARVIYTSPANIESTLGIIYDSGSRFTNLDGRLSEITKRLQDSRYYQEFSYVIRSGQSIDIYRNAVNALLHPAGLALYGSVDIESKVVNISRLIPEVAAIFVRIFEEFVSGEITLAENTIVLESWARVDANISRDSKFLEANKFEFGPRPDRIGGTSNSYMRQVIAVPEESFFKAVTVSDLANVRFTDIYDYSGSTPFDLDDPFYLTDYYRLNKKKTKITWPADIRGFGESFMLTEAGDVITTESAENIVL